MKKFCLIGYPLGHSMSPLIHMELFKINNIDASYELNEISPETLNDEFKNLKNFDGFNVTIPHKIGIIPNLNSVSDRANLFGAVNTVKVDCNKTTGHNTDCHGFLRSLEMANIDLKGEVLLLGAGGVARMIAFETILAGANLTIAVRDSGVSKANSIKKEIEEKLQKTCEIIDINKINDKYDLLINGTPVGMYPNVDVSPVSEDVVKNCNAIFDVIYNPIETKLLTYARKNQKTYLNGLPMLVWQAAVAQEIWLDVKFSKTDVEKVTKITEMELEKE